MAKDVEMRDASDAAPARARSVLSDAPTESGAEGLTRTGRRINYRRKGVFDAVGGRTRVRESRPKWPGQPVKSRNSRLAPEEALFRSAGAPPRYEETDTYFAHADLPKDTLPSSELVKAVHHYASRYYEALPERVERQRQQEPRGRRETRGQKRGQQQPEKEYRPNRRLIDERSMDETALLAFGILLEEAGRAVLGRNGALVLTEAAGEDEADAEDEAVVDEQEGEQEAKKRKKKEKKKSKKRKRNDDDD